MTKPLLSEDEIRDVMLANGFTIKDGLDDLKPYVYAAAHALESRILAKLAEGVEGEVINVRWDEATAQYKVDRPNWDGGALVPAATLAAARAELEALKAKHQALSYERDGMLEELAAVTAELDGLRKDAGRYQYLRSEVQPMPRIDCVERDARGNAGLMVFGQALDDAIDAAMQQEA